MKGKILLISTGMTPAQVRLQPWKYLWETARGLGQAGHAVTVVSDDRSPLRAAPEGPDPNEKLDFIAPRRRGRGPGSLAGLLERLRPQVILWHVGKTSFLRGPFPRLPGAVSVGIFTSPLYHADELLRIGPMRLLENPSLSAVHSLGACLPAGFIRRAMERSGLDWLVTETETTASRLIQDGLWRGPLKTIFPAVDAIWSQFHNKPEDITRKELGFRQDDRVFLYLGSPAPLRGLPVLIKAFQKAKSENPQLKLLILSRETGGGGDRLEAQEQVPGSGVRTVRGYLRLEQVARAMAASDVVVLPFVLVPSDAPLSLLEAAALGKPLVTTRCACLPELAAYGRATLAEPGDVQSLSSALLQALAQIEPRQHPPFSRSWDQFGQDWSGFIEDL